MGRLETVLGCDRGLAYDLLGQQSLAQADYRAALGGTDADEARRRLALSLAISGNRSSALDALAPLSTKGDSTAARVRAFVLALTGDSSDAMTAVDAAMPGSWSRVAPFLQRLPTLPAGEKAAAVNLGIFPDSNGSAVAYTLPAPTPSTVAMTETTTSGNSLDGIDALLRTPSPSAPTPQTASAPAIAQPQAEPQARAVQVAYSPPVVQSVVQRTEPAMRGIWLQLGSSRNATSLSNQFERLKSSYSDVFKGITAYVAQGADRSLLVIGPFRGTSDASIFAEDLHSIGVDATRWTNSDSDRIVPLASE